MVLENRQETRWHLNLCSQLQKTHETPPSSRDEGLLFLHGLELSGNTWKSFSFPFFLYWKLRRQQLLNWCGKWGRGGRGENYGALTLEEISIGHKDSLSALCPVKEQKSLIKKIEAL